MAPKGNLPPAVVGETIKVFLPGESPWADCVFVYSDGTWEGRIVNRLVGEMSDRHRADLTEKLFGPGRPLPKLHDFRCGDLVRFKREIATDYEIWVPAEQARGRA